MSSEAEVVVIANQQLHCAFCRRDRFQHRKATMRGRAAAIFDLEWLGKSADCYVCVHCGHVHWFFPVPQSS